MSSAKQIVSSFIKKIDGEYSTGTATEHSYRPALKELFEALLPNFKAQNEPKRCEAGAPDFIIADASGTAQAYVEAKDVDDRDLDGKDPKRHKEQFDRYKEAFENIIFTDGLDFRLYREGSFVDHVRIAEVKGGRIVPVDAKDAPEGLAALVEQLIPTSPIKLASAEKLAALMASRAKLLASALFHVLTANDGSNGYKTLDGLYKEFKNILLPELTEREFADIYAQTIAYGMFAARLARGDQTTFSRFEAAQNIPKSNPFLRSIFMMIAATDVDVRYAWLIDSIAQIFMTADLDRIMSAYHGQGFHDPLMHFYEDFLGAYDKVTKKQKGVWYTPSAVVGFIVRSVDEILKADFGLPQGLADRSMLPPQKSKDIFGADAARHKVQILDPATGTGTFLAEVIRQIHAKFADDAGAWPGYVRQHLIPRLIGFEVLMAPYVIAHMKMNLTLEETGFDVSTFEENERIRIYLTNSLEEHVKSEGNLLFFGLTQEGAEANEVKADAPIMVMLGNPPYNGSSNNKGKWILGMMQDYKKEPESDDPLDEKNSKMLNDDYVKFIRLAQNYIIKNDQGVIAFINPHGFIFAPTFRGMRWNLLKSFDKIYCLNLHGNAKLKEKALDGGKDENVFDIQQGVSITFLVKKSGAKAEGKLADVYYADIFGKREIKYDILESSSISNVPWNAITPSRSLMYRFDLSSRKSEIEWFEAIQIDSLFCKTNIGVTSSKDSLVYQDSKELAFRIAEDFLNGTVGEIFNKYGVDNSSSTWNVTNAKRSVYAAFHEYGKRQSDEYIKSKYITRCYMKPFDYKYLFYTHDANGFIGRPRFETMKHMLNDNIAIVVGKIGAASGCKEWNVVVCTTDIAEKHLLRRSGAYLFPLFLYKHESDSQDSKDYFPESRRANLDPEMMKHFAAPSGMTYDPTTPDEPIDKSGDGGAIFTPMDFWHYTYAVLHSNIYRTKFKQFLDADFPRIPAPKSREYFWSLVPLGAKLKELHLMRGAESWDTGIKFPVAGSNIVETPRMSGGKVYINSEQYFESVSEGAWKFFIGGYQPAQKWLKDRKGKALTYDDIEHYKGIIYAIGGTIAIMAEIDENVRYEIDL